MRVLKGIAIYLRCLPICLEKCLLVFLVLFLPLTVMADSQRPNIIVVMGDDHGQWAVGSYGNTVVETPNIDWLARNGVQFWNAFSPAPVCSPARASFYTGKMPSAHGVHDFLAEDPEFDANWLDGEVLLSERLQRLGYRTGLFGKWHATTDSLPPQRGFDRWVSYDGLNAGWENQYLHRGTVHFSVDGKRQSYTGTQARYLTEEAIRFVDDVGDEPFFLSINFVEPHAPFEGLPERLVDRYRQRAAEQVPDGDFSDFLERSSQSTIPADHAERIAQYFAAVTLIDEQIGRLLDALEGRSLLENTVVIYTADHGLLVGQYGLYGKTNATVPANFYEETIRIPLVVFAPAQIARARQQRNEFVDLIDLHATVLDLASVGDFLPLDYSPGRSMRSLLAGNRTNDWRSLQFAERGNMRMVSDGRWKLVREYAKDELQRPRDYWFDLAHPQGERRAVLAPRKSVQTYFIEELEAYFQANETVSHSGRNIWSQPPPNSRMKRELELN